MAFLFMERRMMSFNINRTKELIMHFNDERLQKGRILLEGTGVERAESYRFLGLQVTSDLSWSFNTAATVKKTQQQQYFIILFRKAGLKCCPLIQTYRGLIEITLTTGITVWYGNTTQVKRMTLQRVIKTTETKLPSMGSMYLQRCCKTADRIIRDSLHPHHSLLRHKHCTYNPNLRAILCAKSGNIF